MHFASKYCKQHLWQDFLIFWWIIKWKELFANLNMNGWLCNKYDDLLAYMFWPFSIDVINLLARCMRLTHTGSCMWCPPCLGRHHVFLPWKQWICSFLGSTCGACLVQAPAIALQMPNLLLSGQVQGVPHPWHVEDIIPIWCHHIEVLFSLQRCPQLPPLGRKGELETLGRVTFSSMPAWLYCYWKEGKRHGCFSYLQKLCSKTRAFKDVMSSFTESSASVMPLHQYTNTHLIPPGGCQLPGNSTFNNMQYYTCVLRSSLSPGQFYTFPGHKCYLSKDKLLPPPCEEWC